MSRVYNFSAGPAVLPEEVLKEAAAEMLDYRGTGMSVMEMSHRSKSYETIIEDAESDLRDLLHIPENYKVLFLQGGGSTQFAMVPMNLMKNRVADYIITGQWAKKAHKEASIYGKANAIASSADKTFSYIPDCSDLPVSEDADYVYICENNTIYGTKFWTLPNTKGKLLVADQSSCFLSEPVDVSKYGLIFAGAQKNVGPAGTVIVIIREDLITEDVLEGTPTMLRYKIHADAKSLYNTPPTYGIYMCGKVFKWLKSKGGLEEMKKINEAYDTITKMRSGGGASGGYQSQGAYRGSYQGGYQQQYSSASSGSLYNQVRQAINMGDIGRAEQLLRGAASQDAEWHFLTGSIAYRKGWLDEATQHFQMACNMDPANGEYRQALMMMRQGGQAYRPYGYGGGIDACDCCTACLCMNMCCGN